MHPSSLEAASSFYQSSPGVRVFRVALGTFQRLWPALAVRAAYRLFGTPLPPRWLQRRRAWDASWRVERWPFEDASLTVYAQARRRTVRWCCCCTAGAATPARCCRWPSRWPARDCGRCWSTCRRMDAAAGP